MTGGSHNWHYLYLESRMSYGRFIGNGIWPSDIWVRRKRQRQHDTKRTAKQGRKPLGCKETSADNEPQSNTQFRSLSLRRLRTLVMGARFHGGVT
jgi:hypothetical protein